MSDASAVRARLESYWKMEVACALLFPILAVSLAKPASHWEWGGLLLALLACCSLLLLGGLYWRAALRRLNGDPAPMIGVLTSADRLQTGLLTLCVLATNAVVILLATSGAAPAVIAAAGFALLADLEYVNYFHRQLQHFDHLADFRRLIRTRRFRASHMALDLAEHRRSRRDTPAASGS